MGTRNTLRVTVNGDRIIDQYGQWDGYPTGQGADLLNFCTPYNIRKLVEKYRHNKSFDERYGIPLGNRLLDSNTYDSYSENTLNINHSDLTDNEKEFLRSILGANPNNRDWGVSILYLYTFSPSAVKYFADNGIDAWGEQEGNYTLDIIADDEVTNSITFTIEAEFHGFRRTYTDKTIPNCPEAVEKEMQDFENEVYDSDEEEEVA